MKDTPRSNRDKSHRDYWLSFMRLVSLCFSGQQRSGQPVGALGGGRLTIASMFTDPYHNPEIRELAATWKGVKSQKSPPTRKKMKWKMAHLFCSCLVGLCWVHASESILQISLCLSQSRARPTQVCCAECASAWTDRY
jgi:hypothetical protein